MNTVVGRRSEELVLSSFCTLFQNREALVFIKVNSVPYFQDSTCSFFFVCRWPLV
jgi:hypothetical protein